MVLMLPTATDNGARLAAILPTGLATLARGLGADPSETLRLALRGRDGAGSSGSSSSGRDLLPPPSLPAVRSLVLVVVDGLGSANLQAAKQHAPTLAGLAPRRIETVIPSTTGAALTTLATGRLPGRHGLIGYRIRHPELGLRSTLKEWQGIDDVRSWQLAEPLWGLADGLGARAVAVGRPAHATGGLTEAILSGAEYLGGQTIEDRFATVSSLLRGGDPVLAYLYVDELDRAAHSEGWQSATWTKRLEALDAALADLLRSLPGDVGIVVTADHGMLDIPPHRRLMLDEICSECCEGEVAEFGGEPRMRSLYLAPGADAVAVAERVGQALGKLAWAGTRDEAIAAGWFGPVSDDVRPRLGEVIVAARAQVAFTLSQDPPAALEMVGQHGGLSSEERGVPLALAGALAESGFATAVAQIAKLV